MLNDQINLQAPNEPRPPDPRNLLDIDDDSLVFEKRRGTTDEGKDFEDLYVANLVLDLITRPRVTNFKVAANHSRFGAYDDVVCDLDSPNPQLAGKAALQLKYSNTGGQITPTKLNSWDKNCGLLRYFDEYVKVCDDLGTCQYFLVTNRKFAPTDFSLVDGKSGVDFDMTVTTADTENRRFRFTIRGSKNTNVDVPLLQKYQRFFDNFTLIANYDSVSALREKIDQKFRSLFACQDDSVCKRYVDFVQSWSLKPGKKTVLHSSLMKHVIGLMVLSPSAEFFSPQRGQIGEKYDYLRDAVSKFDITLLAEDKSDKIKKLWNGVRDDLDCDYLRKAKIFGIMRLGVSSFDDLNDEEYTKLLWLIDECPLIVKDGEGVQKAIRLYPTLEEINRLEYVERVIKETLRLIPLVPFLMRSNEADITSDPYVFPAGCNFLIPVVTLHRDPEVWPDPEKFDPDRFLSDEVAKRHRCSFIPFSFGSRNCIGLKYGMMSMKVMIAMIVKKFKIRAVGMKSWKDMECDFLIMLKPKNSHLMFEKRTN
ncbi:hypothetical protein Zmor_016089 [Zophobas morio]|uniref:Cytochrome P450 4V2 n=1 Tax=Zophobas morio TaxID=2755281 RepID=A0AA38IJ46_9CUCU|nr:hypothetical protein Zmor_016089 [Zophobas morio]